MLDPVTTSKLAQIRYTEMLTEAQVARRIRRTQPVAPLVRTALSRLGSSLVIVGQKLKASTSVSEAEATPVA